jgi:hypothetical protein
MPSKRCVLQTIDWHRWCQSSAFNVFFLGRLPVLPSGTTGSTEPPGKPLIGTVSPVSGDRGPDAAEARCFESEPSIKLLRS